MRIVRIVEAPAFVRLRDWWQGLSVRERWLVGTLGVILALLILVFGIVKPLQASRAQSIADIRTYETLTARINAAGSLGPSSAPPPRSGTAAEVLNQSAGAYGLSLQIVATPDGVRATVADGDYAQVINWMADVARTTSLAATRVEMQRLGTPGRVLATVDYRG
ncbi:type II secretion system protein GspM [Sphingomonas sp. RS2018]